MGVLQLAVNRGGDFRNNSILISACSFPGRSSVMLFKGSSREGGFFLWRSLSYPSVLVGRLSSDVGLGHRSLLRLVLGSRAGLSSPFLVDLSL